METEWRCINNEVFAAADSLNVGEFITTESFNLYDAMSAIELMDPKMVSFLGTTDLGVVTFFRNALRAHTRRC
jgi:hypothetical protein